MEPRCPQCDRRTGDQLSHCQDLDYRKMTSQRMGFQVAALLLALGVVAAACDKNTVQELPIEPLLGTRVKFFNFGVNAPGVNFYADQQKMTAVQSGTGSEATTGVAYGGVGNGN